MKIEEAIQLLGTSVINTSQPTQWADLGCGSGLFTKALATLLAPGSNVFAVDNTNQSIDKVINDTSIIFKRANFITDDLALPTLDGILMANSLHYVADKSKLLQKLKTYIHNTSVFIIVEYDTMRSNTWVPYPVDEQHLRQLFFDEGFTRFIKTGERKSSYGPQYMYACVISR